MFDHVEENAEERAAITNAGAFIMGRRMFGPDRGEWDLDWRGWWGEGIEAALALAREAAGEKDVSIAGGPGTTNQYLAAGLIDELRLTTSRRSSRATASGSSTGPRAWS